MLNTYIYPNYFLHASVFVTPYSGRLLHYLLKNKCFCNIAQI